MADPKVTIKVESKGDDGLKAIARFTDAFEQVEKAIQKTITLAENIGAKTDAKPIRKLTEAFEETEKAAKDASKSTESITKGIDDKPVEKLKETLKETDDAAKKAGEKTKTIGVQPDAVKNVRQLKNAFDEVAAASRKVIEESKGYFQKNVFAQADKISGQFLNRQINAGGIAQYRQVLQAMNPEVAALHNQLTMGVKSVDEYSKRFAGLSPLMRKAMTDSGLFTQKVLELEKAAEHGANGFQSMLIKADLFGRGVALLTRTISGGWQEYLNFGKEIANVNSILGADGNINSLRDGILKLNPALGGATELTRGLYQAISSGINAKDALDFIAVSAKAARAGLASTFDTVDAGTTILFAFNLQAKDATRVYDEMFQTVKDGKIEMPQLAQSIGMVANIAKLAGVSMEEMFAAVAVATQTNKPTIAIEGLRQALSSIIKPSAEAVKRAEELGIAFNAEHLQKVGLAKFLEEVGEKTRMSAKDLNILFGDVQAFNIVASLGGDNAAKFTAQLARMGNAAGNVDAAFAKQQQSLGAQFQTFYNRIGNGLISIFTTIEPAIKAVLSAINYLLPVIVALTVAIGGLRIAWLLMNTQFFATAAAAIPNLIGALSLMLESVLEVTAGTATLGVTLGVATGGLSLLVAGIGLAVYAWSSYGAAQAKTAEEHQKGIDAVKGQWDALNQQKQALDSVSVNTKELAAKQTDLIGVYSTLDATSQTHVDTLTQEKGATLALREEIERLKAAKTSELDARLVSLANDTAAAFQKKQLAEAAAKTAEDTYTSILKSHTITTNHYDNYGNTWTTSQTATTAEINRLGKAYTDASAASRDANTTFQQNADVLRNGAQIRGKTIQQILDYSANTHQGVGITDAFRQSLLGVANAQNSNTQATKDGTAAVNQQTEALENLKKVQGQISLRRERIDAATIDIVTGAKSEQVATKLVNKKLREDNEFRQNVTDAQRIKKNQEAVNKLIDPQEKSKREKAVDPIKEATREVTKLRAEVEALKRGGGHLFDLLFEKETLDESKRQLTEILKLRRQLSTPQTAEQSSRDAELRDLQRLKGAREEIIKVSEEQRDAEVKLSVAQATAGLAVVDAQTRANTTYFDNLRKRRDAEAQLTADLASELRKRSSAEKDSARDIMTVQADVYKDNVAQDNKARQDLFKAVATLQMARGYDFSSNPIIQQSIKIADSPIVAAIKEGNVLLATIAANIGSRSTSPTGTGALTHTSGNGRIDAAYAAAGARRGVDPNLLLEQGRVESVNFNAAVVSGRRRSPVGAIGISQLMPGTAAQFGANPLSIESSIDAQARIMAGLLSRFNGSTRLALAAYNAGTNLSASGAEHAAHSFRETRNYVTRIEGSLTRNTSSISAVQPNVVSQDQAGQLLKLGLNQAQISAIKPEAAAALIQSADSIIREVTGQSLKDLDPDQVKAATVRVTEMNTARDAHDAAKARLALVTRTDERGRQPVLEGMAEEQATAETDVRGYKLQVTNVLELQTAIRNLNALREKGSLAWQEVIFDTNLKRLQDERATIAQLVSLRHDEETSFIHSEDFKRQATERAEVARRQSFEQTVEHNIALEDKLAHFSEGAADRYRTAWLDAQLAIKQADEDAVSSQIKSQVQLADASIVHSEQVRAKVLGHLAEQKTATDVWADSINASYDSITGFLDRGIDKLTHGVGALNSLLKQVVNSLVSRVFQRFLDSVFPSGSGNGGGGAQGSSIFGGGGGGGQSGGIGGFLRGLLGGGSNSSSGSSIPLTTTGGFAGGNPAATFLGGAGGSGGLSSLFGGSGGSSSGGGSGGGILGLLGGLFGGRTSSSASASTLGLPVGYAGTLSDIGKIPQIAMPPAPFGGGAGGGLGSLFGSGQLLGGLGFGKAAGSGGGLAAILPLLGVSLGSKLGGGGLGSIIGGVGGGLLGVGLTAAPAIFGAGGALASPAIAALFSNPITAVVGGALLVGALIYGKNKARQKDEKLRTQYINDAFAQIDDLTKQVGSHRLDGGQALAQAAQIRAQYLQQSGQIKDKKTRGIALKDVSRLDDPHIKALRAASDRALEETARDAKYVPEFASGGIVGNLTRAEMRHVLSMRRGLDDTRVIKVKPGEKFLPPHEHARLLERGGIIPGVDRGIDDTYMRAPVGSLILNKQQQRDTQHFDSGGMVGVNPLDFSGYSGLLAAAIGQFNGYNGMYTGGARPLAATSTGTFSASPPAIPRPKISSPISAFAPRDSSSSGEPNIIVNVTLKQNLSVGIDHETAGKFVVAGVETSHGRAAVGRVVTEDMADGEINPRRN